ncbi:MAG: hypothetical protein N3G18_07590 [Candidatus Saccharicenans sp.]|nr:hypothetical protein [Candidatus Saccharicenans sp.]
MNNITGKNILVVSSLLIGLVLLRVPALRADTAMLSISYGYLFPADSGYKEVYGNKAMVPELKLGFRVISDVYIYGMFSTLSQNGTTPELNEPAHSKQQFLGGGLAYFPYLTRHLKLFIGAGVAAATYKEEAMEITVSGNKVGFLVEGGLYLKEKFVLIGVSGSYCAASDTYEGVDFKIGGARASAVLGFSF